MSLAKLNVDIPTGFLEEEVVTTWRQPLVKGLKADKVLQFQAPVRPNLIATQRFVSEGASLGDLMAKVCADLARHIEGLSNIETTEFVFKDGGIGLLLKYTMPVHGKFTVYQLQAGRLDGRTFTTLTISTEAALLNEEALQQYLMCIAGASVTASE